MINSCSRCRVDSCHPLILLVVANSFHCASCRELSASAIRLSRSRLRLGLARLSLLILWRYSTSNPGEKMNCHACLIVESDCWFLWQHLYRFGFGVLGRRDFLIRTFFSFFFFLSPFWIFGGGNSDEVTMWQMQLYFSRMNVRMMSPERSGGSVMKPTNPAAQMEAQRAGFSAHSSSSPS